nr:uncharacterized protein K02A2.6-like [Lytechinus pictus]
MATPSGYIGRLGSFEKAREPFTSYVERMELFFMANNIVETSQNAEFVKERKKAILLTEIGTKIYVTLANLLARSKPKDATFDDIIDKLKNHFDPKPLEIAESYKFGTRNQKQGETVGEFIIALKNLSLHCNYGSFLNRALRDRFVCGLADERIQNKLLNTQDLDFDKACQIALSMEMASRNARELRSVHNAGSVNSQKSYTRKAKPTSREGKPKPSNAESKKHGNCYRCNSRNHPPQECPFKGSQCFKCEMKGHIAKACKSNRGKASVPSKGKSRRTGGNAEVHALDETDDLEKSMQHNLNLYCMYATDSINKFETEVVINKKYLTMRIDTQADCSIMSKDTYERNFNDVPLRPNSLELRTYSGQQLDLCGEFECEVTYEGNTLLLPMMVTSYPNRPTLMGKNWLTKLKLDWNNVFHVESSKLQSLLRQYSGMFEDSYEGISGVEAHVRIKENSTPVYCRPRPVPYALKEEVEKELKNLEKNKVIVKTDYSDWATPIVVVPKADGSVRLCGDYKTTVNRAVDDECYPLPTSQDLYAELGGTKVFSKLDLSHAYAQLNLDQQSQQYLTINTHMGLYSYTKLPYGIKSSPKIFQATMDKILQGIPHCLCNQDDVLIATTTVDENLDVLAQVLKRLNDHNVKLKRSKCAFVESEVVYLGLKVSSQGLQPVKDKIEPIINAPKPKNVTELRSFLGMVQFYSRFLPDLASVLAPLHKLLQKEQKWEWSKAQPEAYEKCKRMLTSDALLVHYDNRRELKMSCDASSYGVGAVISHVMDNGEKKPIAFASRTLTKSERNYAQIEKEALGIIFGIKKFHQYLYDYNIEYLSSKENAVADALSRLPHEDSEDGTEGSIYVTDVVDSNFPVTATEIAAETQKDSALKQVYEQTLYASNGAAERTVRVVKEALKKQVFDGSSKFSMKRRLANFLLKYRTTPQSTTGFTPAELLMKRRLRTRLSLILPDLSQKVENKQSSQKRYFKGSRRYRSFDVGENVRILAPPHKEGKWELGEVVTVCGSRRYLVDISGRVRSVHVDHMLKASDNQECLPESSDHADLDDSFDLISLPDSAQSRQLNSEVGIEKSPVKSTSGPSTDVQPGATPGATQKLSPHPPRRSHRLRKPIDRLIYSK